jgi:hypothetical protein
MTFFSSAECLLLAQSRHLDRVRECPLSGVKRTSQSEGVTSAFDPKRTWQVRFYRGIIN